ncbi:hypothetical protein [Actinomadura rupiterrae]|uniref:hypothetical protein n=1 Tax=Actinomadura rupiterrae TaxID=559627 RepID=UPI0020A511DB|nr:hypothetical protein [Actinomadura rupiterrae]MCP2343181.1 hypothetical protein [Actinomadura rupiterrae]
MDDLTHRGLATGIVTLPRRPVHVGVWLRMLRTLLDEVSISTSKVRRRSATALELIWDTAGYPRRAGLKVWRPYESLDPLCQGWMLEAAATALHLIGTGQITAQGTLGHLLTIQPHQHVYDGEPPPPPQAVYDEAWEKVVKYFASRERKVPASPRGVLAAFTEPCHTLEDFDRNRQLLITIGFNAAALPDARRLGRHDLLPRPPGHPSC